MASLCPSIIKDPIPEVLGAKFGCCRPSLAEKMSVLEVRDGSRRKSLRRIWHETSSALGLDRSGDWGDISHQDRNTASQICFYLSRICEPAEVRRLRRERCQAQPR